MKSNASTTENDIRILKEGTCPSLSGKSKLTYHIGATPTGEILVRVHSNSAAGFFSREWVPFGRIEQVLSAVPDGKALTSYALYKLFHGKSVNTPCFLFAALKNEGLLGASPVARRQYALLDTKPFLTKVKALLATPQPKGKQKAASLPKKATGKPAAKK